MSAEIVRLHAAQLSKHPQPKTPKRGWRLSPKKIRRRLAYKVAFADRLKRARHALMISEQVAAAAYGVTLKTYRGYETTQSRPADWAEGGWNFAQTFNIDIWWLVLGDEKGPPPRFRLRRVV
jgi:hypothetical protein